MSNTGSQREREFTNLMNNSENVSCIRLAASGGGTVSELPDVIYAVKSGIDHAYVAGEMKYGEQGTERRYIKSEEIDELLEFANNWGAIPVAIHRWAQDTNFYVIPLQSLDESDYTRTGNLPLVREDREDSVEVTQYNQVLAKR